MTTTAVVAEILVAGAEALIWVVLIALSIIQPRNFSWLGRLKDWTTPLTPVVVAVAYALGIIVDRVADSLFKYLFGGTSDPADLRLQVLARGDKVTDFLEYIRSRIRVARVTTLNLAVIMVALPIFLKVNTVATCCQIAAAVLALGGLTIASVYTTRRIGRTYDTRLAQAVALPPPVKK